MHTVTVKVLSDPLNKRSCKCLANCDDSSQKCYTSDVFCFSIVPLNVQSVNIL